MSDTHSSNEAGGQSQPKPERKLPDPAICRARRAGFGDYADCLVDAPQSCPYALSFGYRYLCQSPERAEIITRTEAEQRANGGLSGAEGS
jgi:hypothetical protein